MVTMYWTTQIPSGHVDETGQTTDNDYYPIKGFTVRMSGDPTQSPDRVWSDNI